MLILTIISLLLSAASAQFTLPSEITATNELELQNAIMNAGATPTTITIPNSFNITINNCRTAFTIENDQKITIQGTGTSRPTLTNTYSYATYGRRFIEVKSGGILELNHVHFFGDAFSTYSGNAIYINTGASVTLNDVHLEGGPNRNYVGGEVFADSKNTSLVVERSLIDSGASLNAKYESQYNTGTGAFFVTDSELSNGCDTKISAGSGIWTINNCKFSGMRCSGNTSKPRNRAVESYADMMTIRGSTFTDNRGGGAVSNGGKMFIVDTDFTSNTVVAPEIFTSGSKSGGAIENKEGSGGCGELTIENCVFKGNSVGGDCCKGDCHGGAISSDTSSSLAIESSTFSDNSAQDLGPDIYLGGNYAEISYLRNVQFLTLDCDGKPQVYDASKNSLVSCATPKRPCYGAQVSDCTDKSNSGLDYGLQCECKAGYNYESFGECK